MPHPTRPGNLQASISRLRRGLGRESIGKVPGGYRLGAEVRTDVLELESVIEELAGREVGDAPSRLRELLAACSETPLAGVSPTIAFHPQRERLRELQLVALDQMHRISLDGGGAAASIPELRLRAEAEPARERTQLLHAEGLARVGRTAEALRVISRYRDLLRGPAGSSHLRTSGLWSGPSLMTRSRVRPRRTALFSGDQDADTMDPTRHAVRRARGGSQDARRVFRSGPSDHHHRLGRNREEPTADGISRRRRSMRPSSSGSRRSLPTPTRSGALWRSNSVSSRRPAILSGPSSSDSG